MLFSATMTSKVAKLQRASLHKPVKVEVNDKFATPRNLTQEYLIHPAKHKECYLAALLDMNRGRSGLVFCGPVRGLPKSLYVLRQLGFEAQALHGKMDQPKGWERYVRLNQETPRSWWRRTWPPRSRYPYGGPSFELRHTLARKRIRA